MGCAEKGRNACTGHCWLGVGERGGCSRDWSRGEGESVVGLCCWGCCRIIAEEGRRCWSEEGMAGAEKGLCCAGGGERACEGVVEVQGGKGAAVDVVGEKRGW
jgi:hypothetical protein